LAIGEEISNSPIVPTLLQSPTFKNKLFSSRAVKQIFRNAAHKEETTESIYESPKFLSTLELKRYTIRCADTQVGDLKLVKLITIDDKRMPPTTIDRVDDRRTGESVDRCSD
jgi:hypothetical protein